MSHETIYSGLREAITATRADLDSLERALEILEGGGRGRQRADPTPAHAGEASEGQPLPKLPPWQYRKFCRACKAEVRVTSSRQRICPECQRPRLGRTLEDPSPGGAPTAKRGRAPRVYPKFCRACNATVETPGPNTRKCPKCGNELTAPS